MVDEYRTDEEQIEAIKSWWDENGRSTLLMCALGIAAVVGWQQWQGSQKSNSEAASLQYQQILDAIPEGGEQTTAQFTTVSHLASELQNEHSGSTYAHFAALQMAKLQVEKNDLPAAREQLQWVLDNRAPDPAIAALARLRLARVVFSETGAEAALESIENVETGPYRAAYAELRGDIYDELSQLDKAEQQYGLAKEASGGASPRGNPLLELKYNSVARRLQSSTGNDSTVTAPIDAVETVEPVDVSEPDPIDPVDPVDTASQPAES